MIDGVGGYVLIVAVGIIGFVILRRCRDSNKARGIYDAYIKDIMNVEEEKEYKGKQIKNFKSEDLNKITERFIKSAKENTVNINTEVIIEGGVDKNLAEYESIAEAGSGVVIALGLLGTFAGLVIAIMGIGGILDASITMESFISEIKGPMRGMGTAFFTTIAGVGGSLGINKKNRMLNLKKEEFYNLMEDYLDNTIVAQYQKSELENLSENLENQFNKMTNSVENSMEKLVGEMGRLFEDGVERLVENINESNLDLTKSVKSLDKYSEDLSKLATELKGVISCFNEPVEKFNDSVEEYIAENKGFSEELGKTMSKFGLEVNRTEESFIMLREVISLNREETETLKNILKNEFTATSDSKEQLATVVEKLNRSTERQTEELEEKLAAITGAYKRIHDQLLNADEIENEKRRRDAQTIKLAIEGSNENLKEKMVDDLKGSIEMIRDSVEHLREGIEILIRMQASANERIESENRIIKNGISKEQKMDYRDEFIHN